eukprot:5879142-Prymnesium_polylepis.1
MKRKRQSIVHLKAGNFAVIVEGAVASSPLPVTWTATPARRRSPRSACDAAASALTSAVPVRCGALSGLGAGRLAAPDAEEAIDRKDASRAVHGAPGLPDL